MATKKIKVKPSKMQSKIGFIIGILFLILGFVVIIPTFGLFGIIWTSIAGLIVFINYKNGFSDEGIATHEVIIEENVNSSNSSNNNDDIEKKLTKLNSLYEKNLISKEEYNKKRKELIDKF